MFLLTSSQKYIIINGLINLSSPYASALPCPAVQVYGPAAKPLCFTTGPLHTTPSHNNIHLEKRSIIKGVHILSICLNYSIVTFRQSKQIKFPTTSYASKRWLMLSISAAWRLSAHASRLNSLALFAFFSVVVD